MAMIKSSLSLFLFLWTFTTSELKELKQHFTLQPENKVDTATRLILNKQEVWQNLTLTIWKSIAQILLLVSELPFLLL